MTGLRATMSCTLLAAATGQAALVLVTTILKYQDLVSYAYVSIILKVVKSYEFDFGRRSF